MRSNMDEFSSLHNRLYGKVFSFVRLRINDVEEVKDIVQDVFLKAYNSWVVGHGGIPDENTARNFLYIIAKQRMIDKWRSAKFRLQTDIGSKDDDGDGEVWSEFDNFASDSPMPEEVFKENEAREDLLKMLNQLKKEERELLILRFLEELEYKELSGIYKTSEENIRQRVSRGLQNLRKVANQNKKV